ncbi:MAG: hypothetical protein QGG67_08350 [Gammaproteobacteria bacterium]|nr:hypothetical protein [Gammaproteobacteria bacterium]
MAPGGAKLFDIVHLLVYSHQLTIYEGAVDWLEAVTDRQCLATPMR